MYHSVNPATEETIAEFTDTRDSDIDATLDRLVAGQAEWSHRGFTGRGQVLIKWAEKLRANTDQLALAAAREMGKPVREGRAEVEKCAWLAEYFAENAEALLATETQQFDDADIRLRCDPLGVLFSVTPWNYPFWQIMRAGVPALAAGNTVLNKPASNVIGCAQHIIALFREAGGPAGALATLPLENEQAADIIADDRVAGVALTGSEGAGSAVASAAGKALKKSVLELGGSDPLIVLSDADISAAAEAAAASRFKNAGQVCIAAKRMIVEAPVYDAFTEAFIEASRRYQPGDPEDDNTWLGPMARGDLRDTLVDQVARSHKLGARLVVPGGAVEGKGHFYAPTIATDIPSASPMAREETFGPAAAIFRVDNEDEAVELANNTSFGLSANLWTGDTSRADLIAPRIEAGSVFVNSTTASDPRVPFGGIKRSGYGRELGQEGIREFVNLKTVWVAR
ncbi:NAD-dependent succinate-semialdehyde dehydrogenase [Maricaulis sp. CAU 1757]